MNGDISANNYVQIPNPTSGVKSLGLNGRYIYVQIKAPSSSTPLVFHIDLIMRDRAEGMRVSCSNLYNKISSQNDFCLQVPLNLDLNRWTVVVLDMYELLKKCKFLPSTYMIQNCY